MTSKPRKIKGAFTLEPAVLEAVQRRAVQEDRSASNVVNRILKEALSETPKSRRSVR